MDSNPDISKDNDLKLNKTNILDSLDQSVLESDVDIINYLTDHKTKFIDKLVCIQLTKNSKNILIKYMNMFLFNKDLFEDGLEHFINYLSTDESSQKLWPFICKFNSKKYVNILLKNIVNFIKKENNTNNTSNKINLVDKVIRYKSLEYYKNVFNVDILTVLLENIQLLNSVNLVSKLYINSDETNQQYMFNKISDILNSNISNMCTDIQDYDRVFNTKYNDKLLINVSMILIDIFNSLEFDTNNIDKTYLYNRNCPIKWYSKDINNNNNKQYNMLTKIFFLSLNSMRICVAPLIHRYNTWEKYINKLKSDSSRSMFSRAYEINILEKRYEFSKSVINNKDVLTHISKLYRKFMTYMYSVPELNSNISNTSNNSKNIDYNDTIRDMADFYRLDKIHDSELYKDLYKLSLDIMDVGKITKSPDIIYSYLCLFDILTQKKDTVIDYNVSFTYIVNLFIHFKSYTSSVVDMFMKRLSILLLIKIYITDNNKLFDNFLSDNINKSKKFISIIYNDGCWLLENLNDSIDEINSLHNKQLSSYIYDKNIINTSVNTMYEITSHVSLMLERILSLFTVDSFTKLSVCDEILPVYTTFVNGFLKKICVNFSSSIPVKKELDNKNSKLNNLHYIDKLMLCYLTLSENEKFLTLVADDSYNFDIKYLDICIKSISSELLVNKINVLKKSIQDIIDKKSIKNSYEESDIPEQFKDPIVNCLIENPTLLPDMKGYDDLFLEDKVIRQHLLITSINPFTRNRLDIDMLEQYNSKDEVKVKLLDFKTRLNKWILDNSNKTKQ